MLCCPYVLVAAKLHSELVGVADFLSHRVMQSRGPVLVGTVTMYLTPNHSQPHLQCTDQCSRESVVFAFGHGHTDYVCVAGAGCVLAQGVSAVIGLWHGAVGGVFCVCVCRSSLETGSVALAPSKLADTLALGRLLELGSLSGSCTLCSNLTLWRFARSSAGRRVNRLRPARF